MNKWFRNLTDPDFLLKHGKVISVIVISALLFCLGMIFFLLVGNNAKEPIRKTEPQLEKEIKKVENEKKEAEKNQERLLKGTLAETFTFGELTYKTPDISKLENAFLNTTDIILDAEGDSILFKTLKDGLYIYDIKDADRDYVTDLSIYHKLSVGDLYYVEIQDRIGNRLMKYNIATQEKEELTSLTYNQTISGVARSGNNVYFIMNENGKSYLQSVSYDSTKTGNDDNVNVVLPVGSFLEQEGENVYVVNNTGFFKVIGSKLEKVGETPKFDYLAVKIWNGKPLIYGYNTTTDKSEVYYENKVLIGSDSIFEMWPIDQNYLLVNELNNLKIIDKNTLETKTISPIANNSVVVNGDILFSIAIDLGKYSGGYYYFFEKQ
ncbi:hypothetical protein MZM54_00705 [[Brevibacterium] frigoritolerans]|nr:hypothetical protein [Peribacillus frigoritolerans]